MLRGRANRGFTAVEVTIMVVICVVIFFLGFKAWELSQTPSDTSPKVVPPITPASSESSAPDINSAEDLDAADKSLDATDVDGSESGELDTQTNF